MDYWMGGSSFLGAGAAGSSIISSFFLYALFSHGFPEIFNRFQVYWLSLVNYFDPYMHIKIQEYSLYDWKQSEAYVAIQSYLRTHSSKQAKYLKADIGKKCQSIVLSMDDYEEVTDQYEGITFWWRSWKPTPNTKSISLYPSSPSSSEKRYFDLKYHKKYRGLVTDTYLKHVLKVGKELMVKSRQRKLYANNPSKFWEGSYKKSMWNRVVFDHPSTFATLAINDAKKKELMDDLTMFSKGKSYYSKIGRAWKRGYLLYGPPGTGKSTLIAAMANFLDYDIYAIDLTAIKNNTELQTLMLETTNKSIIVIEDIDCSLNLTGQRTKKKKEEDEDDSDDESILTAADEDKDEKSKVTLSGLLNFTDGLWSACSKERIIVFTTNYVDKLDPALIRRGRMDKHIEMSYCSFEAFKVLAKNYLDLDSHDLFGSIEQLLGETKMTPADVAENLMPKTISDDIASLGLRNLIEALESAKEEARLKAEKKMENDLEVSTNAKEEAMLLKAETKTENDSDVSTKEKISDEAEKNDSS